MKTLFAFVFGVSLITFTGWDAIQARDACEADRAELALVKLDIIESKHRVLKLLRRLEER